MSQRPNSAPLPTRALVRPPSPAYSAFYARSGVVISQDSAQVQHRRYVEALESAGLHVSQVMPDEDFPDCVFIEDTAVIWGGSALVACMAPHREGEQAAVTEALTPTHTLVRLPLGATLDGGDVLHVEGTTYVGLSSRTNQRGTDALAEFLAPHGRRVVSVPVRHCLHLKSAATYLGDGTLLAAPGLLDESLFDVARVIHTAAGESGCANCLRIGDRLLVLAGYPKTQGALERFAAGGLQVVVLDMSEFEKGGGSLTCLSLIW
jgi:dimethylargininase